MKLKLSLPKLSSLNLAQVTFTLINYTLLLFLAFSFWSIATTGAQLDLWVSIAALLAIFRLFFSLFFGLQVWKQAKFDLSVLTFITGIIILTIATSNGAGPSTLGGTNIWGIGMLMLSGLSLYLFHIITKGRKFEKYFLLTLSIGASLPLFSANLSGFVDDELSFLATVLLFVICLVGTKFSNVAIRFLLLFLAINSLIAILQNPLTGTISLAGLAVVVTSIINFFLFVRKNSGTKITINLQNIFKNKKLIFVLVAGLVFLISELSLLLQGELVESTVSIINKYANFTSGIGSAGELLLGSGLRNSQIAVLSFISSYGLVGMLLLVYPLVMISKSTHKLLSEYLKLEDLILVSSLLFFVLQLFIGNLDLSLIFMFVVVITLLFNQTVEQKDTKQADFKEFKPVSFENINSDKLRYFLISLRVIVAAFVLAYTPRMIEILISIF
jgi:hypothetical protein